MNAIRLVISAALVVAALLLGYRTGFNRGVDEGVEMSPALEEPVRKVERARGLYDLDELERRTAEAYASGNADLARYAVQLYADLYAHWLEEEAIEDRGEAHRRLGLAHSRLAELWKASGATDNHRKAALEHLEQADWPIAPDRFDEFAAWLAGQPFARVSRESARPYFSEGDETGA